MYLRSNLLLIVSLSAAAFGQSIVGANAKDAYQVHYFANSAIGDSYIDITNAGSLGGVRLTAGTTASIGGSFCANIYLFESDEQLMECCSCPVTPNGAVTLSIERDLIPNVLEPQLPINGLGVALLATIPANGSCIGSAYQASGAGFSVFPEDVGGINPLLAPGMVAWGTTLHANTVTMPNTFRLTETRFEPKVLLDSEASRMSLLCLYLQANGGGFGLCKGCAIGALGAVRQ